MATTSTSTPANTTLRRETGILPVPPGMKREDRPAALAQVEAYEEGRAHYTAKEMVQWIEDDLLQNRCKTIRCRLGANGRPSILAAYPKLAAAAQSLLQDSDSDVVASANAVFACLLRASDRPGCLPYFETAERLRPQDWRIPNAASTTYMCLGRIDDATAALVRARDLAPPDSMEGWDIESSLGKVFFQGGDYGAAQEALLSATRQADRFVDQLSALDRGHLIGNDYLLAVLYAQQSQFELARKHWNQAEAKRDTLSLDLVYKLAWDFREEAHEAILRQASATHHPRCPTCQLVCIQPRRCSACQQATYCSRVCQMVAWKNGHRQACALARQKGQ